MATELRFGEWLKRNREEHGWSQRELAKLTGGEVTFSQIAKLEAGSRMPGLATLRGLASAFGCSFTVVPDGTLHCNGTTLKI